MKSGLRTRRLRVAADESSPGASMLVWFAIGSDFPYAIGWTLDALVGSWLGFSRSASSITITASFMHSLFN
jgi:hypothetical protein